MSTEIRFDLQPVSQPLSRLLQYAAAFRHWEADWSHLKHQEDFRDVARLERRARETFEEIYAQGRQLAVSMSNWLHEFEDARRYPTLKSYVDSFSGSWVYEHSELALLLVHAKRESQELRSNTPWAVGEMIKIFSDQLRMLDEVATTLERLRKSVLYLEESGFHNGEFDLYGKILTCVNNTGKMFERNPDAYKGKCEEELRDHMLVTLGGALAGAATGETFNKKGKTDILVRHEGVTEFIGECKFWNGEQAYLATIDQLFGYLGWRDSQAALIIYSRRAGFDAVLNKVRSCTETHPNFVELIEQRDETWWSYRFSHANEGSRLISLDVMVYNLSV